MSTANLSPRPSSWQYRRKAAKTPWGARILITCLAILLFAALVWVLLQSWERTRRGSFAFIIDPAEYDRHLIMPLQFGRSARNRLSEFPDSVIWEGESNTISDSLTKLATAKNSPLLIKNDSCLVIVRGYVVLDEQNLPVIACSNLKPIGPPPSSGPATAEGLLSLKALFDGLSDVGPNSGAGDRLVILDLEPISAMPRLGMRDDAVFDAIEATIRETQGRLASNLWVLITRGPGQSSGWNPQSKLPFSTECLVDAFDGAADIDGDRELMLAELCDYINHRYHQLRGSEPLDLLLLRGGVGRVEKSSVADSVWLAFVSPPQADEPKEVPDAKVARKSRLDAITSLVRYRQDDPQQVPAETLQSQPADQPADDAPAQPAAPLSPLERFWLLRDQFEQPPRSAGLSNTSAITLHPIAIAPQVWRKLVRNVLHTEIELFDRTKERSLQSIEALNADLELLLASTTNSSAPSDGPALTNPDVVSWYRLWQSVKLARADQAIDGRVRAADRLQQLIALGSLLTVDESEYRRQAALAGESMTVGDPLQSALEESIQVIANAQANEGELNQQAERLLTAIASERTAILAAYNALDQDLRRAINSPGLSVDLRWQLLRRSFAWLRSTVLLSEQRAALIENLQELEKVETNVAADIPVVQPSSFGQISASRQTRQLLEGLAREPDVRFRAKFAATDLQDFSATLVNTLFLAPCDTRGIDTVPLVHSIAAVPRIPRPSYALLDKTGSRLPDEIPLQVLSDIELTIELRPDATFETQFDIDVLGSDLLRVDGKTRANQRVQVAAGENKRIQLTLSPQRFAQSGDDQLSVRIEVQPVGTRADELKRKWKPVRELVVRLPDRDQIKVRVSTAGLTNPQESDTELTGGVWLKTFASRETEFTIEIFNKSGRARNARVWLLRIDDPFVREKVSGYWPTLLKTELNRLRSQFLPSGASRVADSMLGNALLGPSEIKLLTDRQSVPLRWDIKPGVAKEEKAAAPTPTPATEESASATDATHGFALVVRLLDDNLEMLPFEQDQLIWLIPRPLDPGEYLAVDQRRDRDGFAEMRVRIKATIDGDQKPDVVPKISEMPIVVRWNEDENWETYEMNTVDQPTGRLVSLSDKSLSGEVLKVPIKDGVNEFIARLDVDGWPRALHYVLQRDRETREIGRRNDEIRFAAVEIVRGEDQPATPYVIPLAYYNLNARDTLSFPGNSVNLSTSFAIDFAFDRFDQPTPTELIVFESDNEVLKYWTDRMVETKAVKLALDGRMTLLTTLGDIRLDWPALAQRDDDILNFRGEIRTDADAFKQSADLSIRLDSTPPSVDRLIPLTNPPYYVGQPVQWKLEASDSTRSSSVTPSGVAWSVVSLDANGDSKPDAIDAAVKHSPSPSILSKPKELSFLPSQVGPLRIAAQVWDAVGLASEPVVASVNIVERPPLPKSQENMPAATAPRLGSVKIQIKTGTPMRGVITISPAPKDIRPGRNYSVNGPNPKVEFSNLPEGTEYTLTFDGTHGNKKKNIVLKGVKVDLSGKTVVYPISDFVDP